MFFCNLIHRHRSQRGFTLMELVLAITLLAIMAVVGSDMIVNAFKASSSVQSSSARVADVRYALDRMAAEIREIKREGTTFKLTPIASNALDPAVIDGIEFERDLNNNIAGTFKISFKNNAVILQELDNTGKSKYGDSVLLESVKEMNFFFYDKVGTKIVNVELMSTAVTIVVDLTMSQSISGPEKKTSFKGVPQKCVNIDL